MTEGFGVVPTWVVRDLSLTSSALALLLAMSTRANQENMLWPSHRTLADDAGMSERSVQRALVELRDAGLVTWQQRHRDDGSLNSNVYSLHLTPVGGGATQSPGVVPHSHQGGATVAEEVTPREVNTPPTPPSARGERPRGVRLEDAVSTADKFTTFLDAMPKRTHRREAAALWITALTKVDADYLIGSARRYARDFGPRDGQSHPRFAANPARWLDDEMWTDYPPQTPSLADRSAADEVFHPGAAGLWGSAK